VSMDSNGFTMNYTTTDANAGQVISLALKGVRAAAGSFAKSTGAAPVSQAVTGVRFRPNLVLLASGQNTASTSGATNTRVGIGGNDGTTEGSAAFTDTNGLSPTSVQGVDKTTKVFVKVNNNTQTIDAEADMTSLDATGFTLNWTTNDAVATEIGYLALAGPRRVIVIGSAEQPAAQMVGRPRHRCRDREALHVLRHRNRRPRVQAVREAVAVVPVLVVNTPRSHAGNRHRDVGRIGRVVASEGRRARGVGGKVRVRAF